MNTLKAILLIIIVGLVVYFIWEKSKNHAEAPTGLESDVEFDAGLTTDISSVGQSLPQ